MNEQSSNRTRTPPVWGIVFVAVGLYLIAGFAYVFVASDWPPFWPPMNETTAIVDHFGSTGAAAIGATLLFGLLFLLAGPILVIVGAAKIRAWRNASASHDQIAE